MERLREALPLSKAGERVLKVVHIAQEDVRTLRKLVSMGIMPGRRVEVLHRFPSYVIRVGNTTVALGEEVAGKIYVAAAQGEKET
ncbi:FeoA family protein [Thermococcus litoralis]|uniref:FeoA family protein n=1 Tax=Thermococcus litoralis TaxID=2265 RepID=UPI000B35CA4D|nr:FeoA family protein [Thermococcus litoralis]